MVVNRLDCAANKKYHSLACGHASEFVCYASSECIKKEAFEWVIVESAICVGNVQAVVTRVKCCWLLSKGVETGNFKTYYTATYSCASHDEGSIAMYPRSE